MTFRILIILALLASNVVALCDEPARMPGFHHSQEFSEQHRWTRLDSGVRVFVNAPQPLTKPNRLLVIYATPNGNTIEQTLGCAMAEGRDWHFDIQHVAAQIRRLREISADEDIVLAVVQAPKLSWPAFRQAEKNAGGIVKSVVEDAARDVDAKRIVLSGHSGGGSFMFGYLNAVEEIPANIQRIVFLDANYAYSDDEMHGNKLLNWLGSNDLRKLVVVAYDDREITLNGKKVVSATGGTFRASQRMIDRFSKDFSLTDEKLGPFSNRSAMQRQIEFFIHPNPDNKILHTTLVGEMNGLLHGLTLGTPLEEKWGTFGGPLAYEKWIQAEPPSEEVSEVPECGPFDPPGKLELPPRPADAITGSAFLRQIEALSRQDRERAVEKEILRGNIPDFLRVLKPIDVEADKSHGRKYKATYFVTIDDLAIGSDDDFIRIPMIPKTAQAVATAANASLITPKISDDIFANAELKLDPRPLTKDREAAATFYQHHQIIEEQRKGKPLGLLIAGIKKDVVLTNRLKEKPNRVAIYGWHYPNGKPIQPLYVGHLDWYVDYSHGIRLMSQQIIVDGRPMRVSDVLKDKELSALLSNEGPIEIGY